MAREPDWGTASRALAELLDEDGRRRYPSARVVTRYLGTSLSLAFRRWDKHESGINVIGYLITAGIAIAALLFGVDPNDPKTSSLVFRIFGGLGIGLAVWLGLLWFVISPARIWEQQQRSIIDLLNAVEDLRDLESLIRRLREVQEEGTGFLAGLIDDEGGFDVAVGQDWMRRIQRVLAECGVKYQARYASITAAMWRDTSGYDGLIVGLMDLLTRAIDDLEGERTAVRARATAVTFR